MYRVMKSNREFSDILDECLERLFSKRETLEQCLASYPEQAIELKPLLETALATKQTSAIEPSPEFKARARYEFRSALQGMEAKRGLSFLEWWPRWATVVAIVLVLLLAGGGTVTAASGSMPNGFLYPVKIASEQVRLTLTPSKLGKAELYANLADKRVSEIVYVASKGDMEQVELTTQRLNNALTSIATLVSTQKERGEGELMLAPAPVPAPAAAPNESDEAGKSVDTQDNDRGELRQILAQYAISHPARLRAALEEAPESIKPALLQAIDISVAGYDAALKATAE